jgi:hypothetical protein
MAGHAAKVTDHIAGSTGHRIAVIVAVAVRAIVMAAAGKLPTVDLVPYCLAQILGGLVALEIYKRFKL